MDKGRWRPGTARPAVGGRRTRDAGNDSMRAGFASDAPGADAPTHRRPRRQQSAERPAALGPRGVMTPGKAKRSSVTDILPSMPNVAREERTLSISLLESAARGILDVDHAALAIRPSISLRSKSKSMGFVRSASAPPSRAFRLVSASP